MVVTFNKPALKGWSKEKFVKRFCKLYPHLDLEAEYDKMFPQAQKPKTKKPKEKAKNG